TSDASLEDPVGRQRLLEDRKERLAEPLGARGDELQHRVSSINIDHRTRESVAFAVHQAKTRARLEQSRGLAKALRVRDSPADKLAVDRLVASREEANRDRPARIVRADSENGPVVGLHAGEGAGTLLSLERRDGAREDPRMAGARRPVLPGLELDVELGPSL